MCAPFLLKASPEMFSEDVDDNNDGRLVVVARQVFSVAVVVGACPPRRC